MEEFESGPVEVQTSLQAVAGLVEQPVKPTPTPTPGFSQVHRE